MVIIVRRLSWPQDDMSDDAMVGRLLRARGHSDDVSSRGHVDDLHTAASNLVVVRQQLGARDRWDILLSVVQCIESIEVQHESEVRHRIFAFSAYPEVGLVAADGDREEYLPVCYPS